MKVRMVPSRTAIGKCRWMFRNIERLTSPEGTQRIVTTMEVFGTIRPEDLSAFYMRHLGTVAYVLLYSVKSPLSIRPSGDIIATIEGWRENHRRLPSMLKGHLRAYRWNELGWKEAPRGFVTTTTVWQLTSEINVVW